MKNIGHHFDRDSGLTDKERILLNLVNKLASTLICTGANTKAREHDSGLAHFDYTLPTIGDLVLCKTSGIHRFTVGYVHEILSPADMIIRELDSDSLCRIGNEGFHKIVGMPPALLRVGAERVMADKIWKALAGLRDTHFPAIYRGWVDFLPDRKCAIHIGRHIFAHNRAGESEYFTVEMPWRTRTSVASIRQAVLDSGAIEWARREKCSQP